MGADDEIARAARRRQAVVRRTLAARRAQERRFWIGVACAAVLHAALFFGVGRSASQRQLGEPDASPEGIAVELVDAADLMSRSTVAADNPPASPPSAAQPHLHPRNRRPKQHRPLHPHPSSPSAPARAEEDCRDREGARCGVAAGSGQEAEQPAARRQEQVYADAPAGPAAAEPARCVVRPAGSLGGVRPAAWHHALGGE